MPYKLTRKRKRIVKRRPFNMTRRKRTSPKGGFLKAVRWSSQASPNVHINIVGADANPAGTAATFFNMNNVNGFAEFVSLFDQFTVTRILYRWTITRNPDQVTTATNKGIYPRVVWTHDFNDSAPISRDLIYQRANMKEFYFSDNRQVSRWYSLKPSILAMMYESSVATAYSPQWRKWLDTSDNASPWYGIKYAYDNVYTGMNLQLEAKIFMEFKGIS